MKKNLLMGLVGLGAFALLATGVKAETLDLENTTTTGQIVTVGDVDVPVYGVDIEWGDMAFDYKYNDITNEYYWRGAITCIPVTADDDVREAYRNQSLDLYEDNTCETEVSYEKFGDDYDMVMSANMHHAVEDTEKQSGYINISDNSRNGEIIPSITWTSEDKYDFVNGKFSYMGFNSVTQGTSFKELVGNIIPEDGRMGGAGEGLLPKAHYEIKFALENDSVKTPIMPTKGDKIGTITIDIDTK